MSSEHTENYKRCYWHNLNYKVEKFILIISALFITSGKEFQKMNNIFNLNKHYDNELTFIYLWNLYY